MVVKIRSDKATSSPCWWLVVYMDIDKYKANKDFDRNEAIYILHTVDKKPLEELATNFELAIEELQEIISPHTQYEAALV